MTQATQSLKVAESGRKPLEPDSRGIPSSAAGEMGRGRGYIGLSDILTSMTEAI